MYGGNFRRGIVVVRIFIADFFKNPIAGPFVLGISSGAKMFVAITMIFLLKYMSGMPLWAQVAAAFVGSLLAMLYVLLFANRVKSMSMLPRRGNYD